ncbi:hypothetical protein PZH33_19470, partial [Blautia schinkii]|nr:hypothetical protein [Blautia schinkii]
EEYALPADGMIIRQMERKGKVSRRTWFALVLMLLVVPLLLYLSVRYFHGRKYLICSSSGYTDGCQYRDHHDFSCLRLPYFKHHKERYHCRYDHDQAAFEILSSMKISH